MFYHETDRELAAQHYKNTLTQLEKLIQSTYSNYKAHFNEIDLLKEKLEDIDNRLEQLLECKPHKMPKLPVEPKDKKKGKARP